VGQYDQAIESELKCLRREPKLFWAHVILGWAYERKRMYPEALTELREAVRLTRNSPFALAAFGEVLAASGNRRGAVEVLAQLQQRAKTGYVSSYDVSMIYAALGERDQAFAWLDQAWHDRASLLPYITWDRRADSLRSDRRFPALLQRLGLQAGSAAAVPLPGDGLSRMRVPAGRLP
jgi:tetratricopeptide (TPR) repeat protein